MQFLVLGYDSTDDDALARHTAVRDEHLAGSQRMYASDRWQDSGALLDDEGTMIGSFIVCDYASREELERHWLRHEPYVVSGSGRESRSILSSFRSVLAQSFHCRGQIFIPSVSRARYPSC